MSVEPQLLDPNQADRIVDVNERFERMPLNEQQIWKKRCIYRVPVSIVDHNHRAYCPQVVSFGPYHHGEEHLRPMEEHKHRACLHFLKRSGKPHEPFLKSLREVAPDLEESYDALDPMQVAGDWFLELMLTDGCFMLEILRTTAQIVDDYALNDPIFSSHGKLYIMQSIRRDMLMLENQLPMLVLNQLVAVESDGKKDDEFVNKLILNFFSPSSHIRRMGKCLHVLDVFRKSMLMEPTKVQYKQDNTGHDDSAKIIRSVTELGKAGIRLKKSQTDSLKDITFANGVLRLPMIVVDDTTESMFLNLMAFERLHVGAGDEITSYIFFMDGIIDHEQDVRLLHARDIIQNAIGSDKAFARLFNSLATNVTLEPDSSLYPVCKKVSNYCNMPLHKCRVNLIDILSHFSSSNVYITLSIVAAVFIFVLTIIQTVYTVLSYYK